VDEEELLSTIVQVTDAEAVKHFLKRGEKTSQETYEELARIIAECGALYVPVRELPNVKQALAQLREEDSV